MYEHFYVNPTNFLYIEIPICDWSCKTGHIYTQIWFVFELQLAITLQVLKLCY